MSSLARKRRVLVSLSVSETGVSFLEMCVGPNHLQKIFEVEWTYPKTITKFHSILQYQCIKKKIDLWVGCKLVME